MPIRRVFSEKLLYPEFQPIVAVNEGRIIGYEALIRGPENLDLRSPQSLLYAATQLGLLRELERECFSAIVQEVSLNLDNIPRWSRIFINVLPEDILDPTFYTHMVDELRRTRLDPARIVLEITESSRIDDYQKFTTALARYRELRAGIAVDDAGAGHAGLQMIAEINPDFLKIDQSLVRGLEKSIAKRAGVEALLLLARSLGMAVIAEGIETEDELLELSRLGVLLGQGFLLARPQRHMVTGVQSTPCQRRASPWGALEMDAIGGTSGRIGDIAQPAPTASPDVPLRKVMQIFEGRRSCDSMVVVERGKPTGLLMRTRFMHEVARPFAENHLATSVISQVATDTPLVVDCMEQLERVAQVAMARAAEHRYDDIIVCRDGKLAGIVSVQQLLATISSNGLASTSHANALTALPGHPAVESWLRDGSARREPQVLMHIDIDSLRTFNSIYGFRQGDRAIRIAAELLSSEVAAATSGVGKLAHVGGDDFLAVVDDRGAEHLSRVLPVMFRERVNMLYHPEDRSRGFLVSTTPLSGRLHTPLLSLTIAWVRSSTGRHQHYAELLDQLADARNVARARSKQAREAELQSNLDDSDQRRFGKLTISGGGSAA